MDDPRRAATTPRVALGTIAVALGLMLVGYGGQARGAAWTGWCLALGTALAFGGFLRLGVARRAPSPAERVAAWGTAAWLAAAFAVGLAGGDRPAVARLVLGLPVPTALVFLGIALVPAVALPLLFALSGERAAPAADPQHPEA